MSETKHTPGRWIADAESGSANAITIFSHIEMRYVAEVLANEKTDELTEEDKANARLIAAAPELLTCLKDAVSAMRIALEANSDHFAGRDEIRDAVHVAEKLIFRAEGKS